MNDFSLVLNDGANTRKGQGEGERAAPLARIALLLFLAFGSGTLSFFFVGHALAQGTHCNSGNPFYPCGRYYAGESGVQSNGQPYYVTGIQGQIISQLVSMYDVQHDFIADWIGVTESQLNPAAWIQMGVWEGQWPNGGYIPNTTGYYEYKDPCDGYHIQAVALVNYSVLPSISTMSQQYLCGGVYTWRYKVAYEYGTLTTNIHLPANVGRADANTEHLNNSVGCTPNPPGACYMEPNGYKCYGTTPSCTFGSSPGRLQLNQGIAWFNWSSSIPTLICPGSNPVANGCAPAGAPTFTGYQYIEANANWDFLTIGSW
jgi:hypothetical protein